MSLVTVLFTTEELQMLVELVSADGAADQIPLRELRLILKLRQAIEQR